MKSSKLFANTFILFVAVFTAFIIPSNAYCSQIPEDEILSSVFKEIAPGTRRFFDFRNLSETEWEEVEKKLSTLQWSKTNTIQRTLFEAAEDALMTEEIATGLIDRRPLTEKESTGFISLARKYAIDDVDTLETVLSKHLLRESDYRYLEIQITEILDRELHIVSICVKFHGWMRSAMGDSDEERLSPNALAEWKKQNDKLTAIWRELSDTIEYFKEYLRKQGSRTLK